MEAIEPGINYKNDRSFIIAANIDPEVENTDAFSCFVPLDEAYCDVVITTIYLEYDETQSRPLFQIRAEELEEQSALVQ